MSGVYSLSTTVEITCILPKLFQKIDKEAINRSLFLKHLRTATSAIKLFKLHILLYVKNWATFHHFFHLSFPKVLCENVLFFIIIVLHKDVLLSIITCRDLLLTYHRALSNCAPTHSRPLQPTPTHSRPLQSTPTHSRSLRATPTHSRPLRPTQATLTHPMSL